MTVDFAQLYSQLGIRTDCSIEEFKQACRRRIREQHPDRAGMHAASTADAATQIPLAELLPLYARALRFHRKHGRLPGAPPVHAARASLPRERLTPATVTTTASNENTQDSITGAPRFKMRVPLLLMLAIVATLIGIGAWSEDAPAPVREEVPIPKEAAEAAEAEAGPVVLQLEIGMDAETVRRIQGEPLQQDGSQWIYGPSWLYFENGQLADWYSSPLYPLRTPTRSPADNRE